MERLRTPAAMRAWADDVRNQKFPGDAESY